MSTTKTDPGTAPRWEEIDTVLLDMDGTLLDLHYDNFFWLQVVPQRYALRHGMTQAEAEAILAPRFAAKQGSLDWYCTDFWSRELSLDIAGLKRETSDHIRYLPGAEEFLRRLRERRRGRIALVTNAHRDPLTIKAERTGLTRYFDAVISSHSYGVPKEHPEFWLKLEADLAIDPRRTLFVDDSHAVLSAARRHGIAHIFAIAHPDTTLPRRQITDFHWVERVADLDPA